MNGRIVIAGTGVAGATAAKTLRAEGYRGEIVLLGAEPGLPYRRPMVSKELLAGTAEERRTLIADAEFWRSREIDLRPGVVVERLDVDRTRVVLADGSEIGYDTLLLATGARARPLPGTSGGAYVLRARAEVEPLRAALAAGSLLIVGGGLIGCEVAATARALGAEVTVLHAGLTPLDRVAPKLLGEFYRNLHAENGVEICTEVLLDRVEQDPDGVLAVAADGRTWRAGAALVAIGSVPDTRLAESAGLLVNDGIVVDEHYRTSVEGVFAAGDVATRFDPERGAHVREEHWNSAQAHGAAAAKSMLGISPGTPEVSWGWSMQYGLSLQFAGHIREEDELVVRGSFDDPAITVLGLRGGRLVGAVGVGRPADIRAARDLIGKHAHLDPVACADESLALGAVATGIETVALSN
ncbi:NAD(P)/FAD-dependent oxidoreductase [Nocardia jejuensis]|uniref:NAD(P)/FAD-dependent oxidoreductase n=1 Tax=Nocardia jejuensis TaxID=328049 RepID=UPI0008358E52|nr:FAD-dependent oxidoreductase [Nocardia jejuensis]